MASGISAAPPTMYCCSGTAESARAPTQPPNIPVEDGAHLQDLWRTDVRAPQTKSSRSSVWLASPAPAMAGGSGASIPESAKTAVPRRSPGVKRQGSYQTSATSGSNGARSVRPRRNFAPEYKLVVLRALREDADCKGNQRATARKFGIHRRQVQKWLASEKTIRQQAATSAVSDSVADNSGELSPGTDRVDSSSSISSSSSHIEVDNDEVSGGEVANEPDFKLESILSILDAYHAAPEWHGRLATTAQQFGVQASRLLGWLDTEATLRASQNRAMVLTTDEELPHHSSASSTSDVDVGRESPASVESSARDSPEWRADLPSPKRPRFEYSFQFSEPEQVSALDLTTSTALNLTVYRTPVEQSPDPIPGPSVPQPIVQFTTPSPPLYVPPLPLQWPTYYTPPHYYGLFI